LLPQNFKLKGDEMKKKEEFADDPMMKELHEIREKHYLQTKNLSVKERTRQINQEAEKILLSYGYKMILADRGAYKLLKKKAA
jgi:hypothetical protein